MFKLSFEQSKKFKMLVEFGKGSLSIGNYKKLFKSDEDLDKFLNLDGFAFDLDDNGDLYSITKFRAILYAKNGIYEMRLGSYVFDIEIEDEELNNIADLIYIFDINENYYKLK